MSERLKVLASQFEFALLSELPLSDIIEQTGLSEKRALMAKNRRWTEPLIWKDTHANLQAFTESLRKSQLFVTKGGRFYHVTGKNNKGDAVSWLRNLYQEHWGQATEARVIALGDGANDVPMLVNADYAVLIRSPTNPLPPLSGSLVNRVRITNGVGPQAWSEAVFEWLDKIGK